MDAAQSVRVKQTSRFNSYDARTFAGTWYHWHQKKSCTVSFPCQVEGILKKGSSDLSMLPAANAEAQAA
jgi:hypothetical protein